MNETARFAKQRREMQTIESTQCDSTRHLPSVFEILSCHEQFPLKQEQGLLEQAGLLLEQEEGLLERAGLLLEQEDVLLEQKEGLLERAGLLVEEAGLWLGCSRSSNDEVVTSVTRGRSENFFQIS